MAQGAKSRLRASTQRGMGKALRWVRSDAEAVATPAESKGNRLLMRAAQRVAKEAGKMGRRGGKALVLR